MSISTNGSRAILLATMIISGSFISGISPVIAAPADEPTAARAMTAEPTPRTHTEYIRTHVGPPGKGFDQVKRVVVRDGESQSSSAASTVTPAEPAPRTVTKYIRTHVGHPGKGYDQVKRVVVPYGEDQSLSAASTAVVTEPKPRTCTKYVWTHYGHPGKGADFAKRVEVPCEQRR